MKHLAEIQQEHQRSAGQIMTGYQDALGEIRGDQELAEGEYLDMLSDEQKLKILWEQKAQRAGEAYRKTLEAYAAEVERYHAALAKRRSHLKKQLFGVEGPEGAAALSKTVLAGEIELSALLDVAALAGNAELARAVFVAAEQKGFGDIMARYFDEVNPEARSLYEEWRDLPSEESLERQVDTIDRVVRPPVYDRLMPHATATTQ